MIHTPCDDGLDVDVSRRPVYQLMVAAGCLCVYLLELQKLGLLVC